MQDSIAGPKNTEKYEAFRHLNAATQSGAALQTAEKLDALKGHDFTPCGKLAVLKGHDFSR
ncbi:MAG: hypothetical protein ABSG10_10535, partial [Terracidiphilus sp.]